MIQQATKPAGIPAALAGDIDENVVRLILTTHEWGDYAIVMPNPPTVEVLTTIRDALDLGLTEYEALLQERAAAAAQAEEPKPKRRRTRKAKPKPEE